MIQDYVEDDEAEEVLTGLEKLKRWWDAALWVKRVFMTLKILFFGTVGAGMVGQAVNENFLNDAAVEIGLVQPAPTDIVGNDAMYDELSNLIEDVERLEALITELETLAGPAGPPGKDGKSIAGPMGPPGKSITGPPGPPGKDGVNAVATTSIGDALKAHIKGEH
jgi:hypothetical protein